MPASSLKNPDGATLRADTKDGTAFKTPVRKAKRVAKPVDTQSRHGKTTGSVETELRHACTDVTTESPRIHGLKDSQQKYAEAPHTGARAISVAAIVSLFLFYLAKVESENLAASSPSLDSPWTLRGVVIAGTMLAGISIAEGHIARKKAGEKLWTLSWAWKTIRNTLTHPLGHADNRTSEPQKRVIQIVVFSDIVLVAGNLIYLFAANHFNQLFSNIIFGSVLMGTCPPIICGAAIFLGRTVVAMGRWILKVIDELRHM